MLLITGANGLVGSAVARMAIAQGIAVRAIKRPQSDMSLLQDIENQIDWVLGDVLDIPSLTDALVGITHVVHTAAVVSFVPKDRPKMYKTNVEGTANVVNACLASHVSKLCFLSSVASLGRPDPKRINADEDIVITEAQRWETSSLNSHYAKTKYQAEQEVWRGIAEGLNAVMVCPSIVLGEGDWTKSSTQLFKFAYDQRAFYPKGDINYVDVLDVAQAILQLTYSEITDQRFTLSAGKVSYKVFLEKLADRFGKRPPRYLVKQWMSEILWRIEAIRTMITGQAPLLTKETAHSSAFRFVYPSTKIKEALNFSFRDLDSTIERCCAYFSRKSTN
jgi:nucleoside-diphosphate-sugar epimerase